MKKVILITQFFLPESGAGAKRVYALAHSLRQFDLTVYTSFPSYPSPDLYSDIDLEAFDSKLGFKIKRLSQFTPNRNRKLILRGFHEVIMALAFMIKVLINSNKYKTIITSTPSMFLIPTGYIISKIRRAQFIVDVRDLTWRYALEVIEISNFKRFILRIIESIMIGCIKRADLVISATPGLTEQLLDNKVQTDKIITIANGVDEDFYNCFNSIRCDTHKKPIVTYIGLFGFNHGVISILDVAKQLPGFDFHLYGDGPDKIELERRLESENISNVKLQGYIISSEQLIEAYQNADILFCPIKDIPILNKITIPAKLYEYMATGKPIIYAGKGVAVDFLMSTQCALVVNPNSSEEVATAIISIAKDYGKYLKMGEAGRQFIKSTYLRMKLFQELQDKIHLL